MLQNTWRSLTATRRNSVRYMLQLCRCDSVCILNMHARSALGNWLKAQELLWLNRIRDTHVGGKMEKLFRRLLKKHKRIRVFVTSLHATCSNELLLDKRLPYWMRMNAWVDVRAADAMNRVCCEKLCTDGTLHKFEHSLWNSLNGVIFHFVEMKKEQWLCLHSYLIFVRRRWCSIQLKWCRWKCSTLVFWNRIASNSMFHLMLLKYGMRMSVVFISVMFISKRISRCHLTVISSDWK